MAAGVTAAKQRAQGALVEVDDPRAGVAVLLDAAESLSGPETEFHWERRSAAGWLGVY